MAAKRNNGNGNGMTMADVKENALEKVRDASWDVSMLEGDLSDRGFPEVALRYEAIQKKLEELEAELRKLPLLFTVHNCSSLA
jgi:sulfur transfer complex TusBCD TusB component (DsrH family)